MPRWLIDSLANDGPAFVVADAVSKATIVLCLTTAITAVMRRSAAAVRHRLWSLTLGGLIVLPLLSWLLPGWRLPILPATAGPPATRVSLSSGSFQPTQPGVDRGWPGPDQPPRAGRPDAISGTPSTSSAVVQSRAVPVAVQRESARLMLIWVLGLIAVTLPALAGVVGNEWQRRRSRRVVDQSWLQLLDALTRQITLRRPVELRTSSMPLIPVTWGIVRPVVLLPEQARQWPDSVRRLVLLHELAHIKRWDVGFQLVGRLATALYWFHPLAWYALHRLRAECECACDDYVVHVGARPTDYARQLVNLARSLRPARLTAAVPMTRKSTLEKRIKALFDDRCSHQPLGHRVASVLLAGGLVVLTSLAAVHPGPSLAGRQPQTTPVPTTTATSGAARLGQQPTTAAPAQKTPPAAKPSGLLPETYTFPINVTGRAVDLAGKPVPGAHVYLASRRAAYKRVAETTTNAEGRYEFHDAPLPIERANTVRGRDEGVFQVFGQAEGFGFAWRPEKSFFPRPKPASIVYEPEPRDPPVRYEATDKIVLDLRFPLPAHLSGTVVDDRGGPLADVRLDIRNCESLNVVDNVIGGWTLDALNERDSVPASMKIRTTGADGRFDFTGLPIDCRFRINVRAKNFPSLWVYAATTREPQPDYQGSPVGTGDLKVTFVTPLDVQIKVVFGDTGEPAPRVAVSGAEGLVSTLETTDEQGRVMLRLPAGRYRMELLPAHDTSYLVTGGELVVGPKPAVETVVAKLRPAGILEVTVVDAETGAGVADVDLWQQTDPDGHRQLLYFRSWEVATRIAWVERPRTDARGKLRALVEPGKHRIGVGFESYPRGQQAVESGGQEVEFRPGETVPLKFTMRKRH